MNFLNKNNLMWRMLVAILLITSVSSAASCPEWLKKAGNWYKKNHALVKNTTITLGVIVGLVYIIKKVDAISRQDVLNKKIDGAIAAITLKVDKGLDVVCQDYATFRESASKLYNQLHGTLGGFSSAATAVISAGNAMSGAGQALSKTGQNITATVETLKAPAKNTADAIYKYHDTHQGLTQSWNTVKLCLANNGRYKGPSSAFKAGYRKPGSSFWFPF